MAKPRVRKKREREGVETGKDARRREKQRRDLGRRGKRREGRREKYGLDAELFLGKNFKKLTGVCFFHKRPRALVLPRPP